MTTKDDRSGAKWIGYQSALDDIAAALDQGGTDAVFEWVHNNAASADTRATVAHMVKGI